CSALLLSVWSWNRTMPGPHGRRAGLHRELAAAASMAARWVLVTAAGRLSSARPSRMRGFRGRSLVYAGLWPADQGASAAAVSALRDRRRWAPAGNRAADKSPAASNEAAAVGVIFPVASPMWVATMMKVSVVACSRPAARARRVPVVRR